MNSILVTGSSRGIGKSIALTLAQAGYQIVVHCRSRINEAEATLEEIKTAGGNGRCVQFDISDRDQSREIIEQDIEANGAYYGIVCNAGLAIDGAFPALSGEDWDKVLRTNLDGFYNVIHPAIMPMIRRKKPGRIVTLASVSGLMGNRGQVNYSAAKAGIMGATKALAIEVAKRKITVNCVAPGIIETEMVEDIPIEEALKLVPMNRMGTSEEVASLVEYLMSENASYITRQVISVNGGMF